MRLPQTTIIITGRCRGADRIAEEEARKLKMPVQTFPANWQKYGRSTGPIRNQEMIDLGKPDIVIAFHNDIKNSRCTKDMVKRAEKAGLEI